MLIRLTVLSVAAAVFLSASAAVAGPVLDHIKSNKQVSLGYRESSIPFSYLGAGQKPVGFSLDLCSHIGSQLKENLSIPDLETKFVAVNSSNRIPLIQSGLVDIECGGTSSSKKRLEQVMFSVSTFASQPSWLTLNSNGLKTLQDMKGKTVAVTQGSDFVGIVQNLSQQEHLDLRLVQGRDHAESFMLLTSGRAAAFFEGDILLAGLKAQSAKPSDLSLQSSDFRTYYFGLMFSKDDPDFKKLVDDVLIKLMASGEFAKIYAKWFTSPIPPNNMNLNFPMSGVLKERVAHPTDAVDY